MKNKIILFLLLLVSAFGSAQIVKEESSVDRATKYLGGLQAVKAFLVPLGNHNALYPNLPMNGRVQINTASGELEYYYNQWKTIGAGTGGDGCGFTADQCARLKALVYNNSAYSMNVSPVYAERGISQPVTVSYNIVSGDDTFTAASITQSIGSVLDKVNTGVNNVSGGSRAENTTYTLNLSYIREGVAKTDFRTATYSTVMPQWAGTSTVADFTGDYASLNTSTLGKYVLSTSQITRAFTPSAQYDYFVVTSGSGSITGNGFTYSIGAWGDNTTFFWRKSITLTLANGTTGTVYVIRSREIQNASITFIHSN